MLNRNRNSRALCLVRDQRPNTLCISHWFSLWRLAMADGGCLSTNTTILPMEIKTRIIKGLQSCGLRL